MRGPTDGGAQEWDLARRYRTAAAALRNRWPRTGTLLKRVSESYEHEARRWDDDAELTEDTWK